MWLTFARQSRHIYTGEDLMDPNLDASPDIDDHHINIPRPGSPCNSNASILSNKEDVDMLKPVTSAWPES